MSSIKGCFLRSPVCGFYSMNQNRGEKYLINLQSFDDDVVRFAYLSNSSGFSDAVLCTRGD